MTEKIWAHSGDSHFLRARRSLAADPARTSRPSGCRVPRRSARTRRSSTSTARASPARCPKIMTAKGATAMTIASSSHRPPGTRDLRRPPEGPRRGGHVGRGDVPVDRPVVEPDRGSRSCPRRGPRARTSGWCPRSRTSAPDRLVPAALMPMLEVERRGAGSCSTRPTIGLQDREPPDRQPAGHRRLQPRLVGAAVGGGRGSGHGDRLPHRHRRERPGDRLPRPRRRGAELRRDHLRRPVRRHEAGRGRRARPAPRAQGPDLRGRRHLGAVHRRPHERGLPPARDVRSTAAVTPAEGDPLPSGLRRRSSTTSQRRRHCGRWAIRT